jgi:capsular polysaccharide biosynthesis protein
MTALQEHRGMEEHVADDEISLLDIAVVVAENWLLLVVAPIVAGVLAYAALNAATPRVYESVALLNIDAREAAMAQTAPVLNRAMLESSHLEGYSGSLTQARRTLVDDNFSISKDANSEFYRLTVRGDDPDKAQELLQTIIDVLISSSIPNAFELGRLNQQIEQATASLEELENSLANINRISNSIDGASGISGGELGASIVSLIASIEERRNEVFRLETEREGSVRAEDVMQPPTHPDEPLSRGIITPVVAVVLGVGFLLLVFAFVREGIRNASNDPSQIEKVNRMRRAFWLKPITPGH